MLETAATSAGPGRRRSLLQDDLGFGVPLPTLTANPFLILTTYKLRRVAVDPVDALIDQPVFVGHLLGFECCPQLLQ